MVFLQFEFQQIPRPSPETDQLRVLSFLSFFLSFSPDARRSAMRDAAAGPSPVRDRLTPNGNGLHRADKIIADKIR